LQHLSLEQAQQALLAILPKLKTEPVAIADALGRVLASDLAAPRSLPASEQSAVDGYAVGCSTSTIPGSFRMVGRYRLGDSPEQPLQHNEAVEVKTGGNLPPGTCAVVPREKTRCDSDMLLVEEMVKPGQNIKSQGEDFCRGEIMLGEYTQLDAGSIALLAAMGIETVPVYRRPRIGIVNLAPNVVPAGIPIRPGQTRDSNGPMLTALVQQHGGTAVIAANAPNREMASRLLELLEEVDIVICTGGSYTENLSDAREFFTAIGARVLYWDIAIQPGSHTGAARLDSGLLVSLSGNPAACFVGYHVFVAPVIRAMQGQAAMPKRVIAGCINGFGKAANSRRLVRARAWYGNSGWEAEVLPGQKPSMIRSLLQCNALIDIAAGSPAVPAGSSVEVMLL